MEAWTRPYRDPLRVFTGTIAGLGSAFIAFAAVMIATHWHVGQIVGVVVFAGFATVWLTFAWRLHRTALVVGAQGIRLRWLLLTRTIEWQSIREFRTRTERFATRLVIELVDGTMVRTPVQRVPQRLFGSVVRDGGTWLRPEPYEQLLAELHRRLTMARTR